MVSMADIRQYDMGALTQQVPKPPHSQATSVTSLVSLAAAAAAMSESASAPNSSFSPRAAIKRSVSGEPASRSVSPSTGDVGGLLRQLAELQRRYRTLYTEYLDVGGTPFAQSARDACKTTARDDHLCLAQKTKRPRHSRRESTASTAETEASRQDDEMPLGSHQTDSIAAGVSTRPRRRRATAGRTWTRQGDKAQATSSKSTRKHGVETMDGALSLDEESSSEAETDVFDSDLTPARMDQTPESMSRLSTSTTSRRTQRRPATKKRKRRQGHDDDKESSRTVRSLFVDGSSPDTDPQTGQHSLGTDTAKLKLSKRSSTEKSCPSISSAKRKKSSTDADREGFYPCPWPNCHKTFSRIKSRSAHLKWHGGDFRNSESLTSQLNGGSSSSGDEGADMPVLSPGTHVTIDEIPPVLVGSLRPIDLPLEGVIVGHAVSHDDGDGSALQYKVSIRIPPGATQRMYLVPASYVVPDEEEQGDSADDSKTTLATSLIDSAEPGSHVFYRIKAPRDGAEAYGMGVLNSVSNEDVIVETDTGEQLSVGRGDACPRIVVDHDKLKLGMRVLARCSTPATSADGRKGLSTLFFPGTIHRIEPTRARVNFDARPLAWKKAPDLSLLLI